MQTDIDVANKSSHLPNLAHIKGSDSFPNTTYQASGETSMEITLDRDVEHAALYDSVRLNGPAVVRLLQFEEDRSDGLVRCRLVTMSLDVDPAPYVALSYAWGATYPDGAHLTDTILCNGHPILVTYNLHAALQRISKLFESHSILELSCGTAIWIDAICIDQRNIAERGQQVSLMSSIYSQARSVLVWLGEFTEQNINAEAATFHPEACACKHCTALVAISGAKEWLSFNVWRDLAARPWFQRRWVIQESFLARHVHYLIGANLLRTEGLCEGFRIGEEPLPPILQRNKGVYMRAEDLPTLLDNLNHYSGALCSQPSDAVFALLGISSDRENFTIDYARDFADVYAEVLSKYSMQIVWPLILKCVVERRDGMSCGNELPWWIPDWRFPITQETDSKIEVPFSCYPYSGELQARINGRYLILNGWLYDDDIKRKNHTHSDAPFALCNNCSSCEWYSDLDGRLNKAAATQILFIPVGSFKPLRQDRLALYLANPQQTFPEHVRPPVHCPLMEIVSAEAIRVPNQGHFDRSAAEEEKLSFPVCRSINLDQGGQHQAPQCVDQMWLDRSDVTVI